LTVLPFQIRRIQARPIITNCTITNNTAGSKGGGVYSYESSPTLNNTIVWGNRASAGGDQTSGNVTMNYCDISGDPLFVNAAGGDYRLQAGSPCIDKGDNDFIYSDYDLDSSIRFADGDNDGTITVDIGAYEYQGGGNKRPVVVIQSAPSGTISDDVSTFDVSTFAYIGSDLDGAVVGYWVSIDVTPPDIFTTETSWTSPLLAPGAHTFYVEAADDSGARSVLKLRIFAYDITPETRSVPDEYRTIQEAIDLAKNGDTILVADGTYRGTGNKNLDFRGKAIHLESAGGAANCIIDCEADGRGFYSHSGETSASILEGFTIQHGGGCGDGGGIHCANNSTPTITNCTMSGNSGYFGGGVYCYSSNPVIANCTISNNSALYGGGVHFYCCNPTVRNCVISNNQASQGGGGIDLNGADPIILNCAISANVAPYGGGGISCGYSSPIITNCTISYNSASGGGGIECYGSSPAITNCTIANNTASRGGGIYCLHGYGPTNNNTILWGNTASFSGNQIYTGENTCTVTLNYCDYANGANDVVGGGTVTANNCINLDPLFLDALNKNYRLQATSPCIDRGDNSYVPAGVITDLDGNPRIQNGTVDMGAYEFQP